jgi:hypothetical protein
MRIELPDLPYPADALELLDWEFAECLLHAVQGGEARCDRIVQRVVVIVRHLAGLSPLPDFFRRLPATYNRADLAKNSA